MKAYLSICAICYCLFLFLPLSAVKPPDTKPDATDTTPSTTVTTPDKPQKPPETEAAVFKVLDAGAGVIYTFAERDFLIYTVAAEMPASYPPEALKAQAVASYTYYTYEKKRQKDNTNLQGADFSTMPSSFPTTYSPEGLKTLWGDSYEKHLQTIASAVDEVYGKRVLYNGEPIFAAYHSANAGRTESAAVVWGNEFAYLQPVVSTGDTLSPHYNTSVTVSDTDFAAAFPDLSLSGDSGTWITDNPTVTESGTVTAITIGGKTFTGKQVREALNLRSACFTVTHGDEGFVFTVNGYGHAVGMSQHGARALAEQGFSYEEILKHYYVGTSVE